MLDVMGLTDILTTEVLFRCDETRRKLVVVDHARSGRRIAEVDLATLEAMNCAEASKFVGEFVTLLVPALPGRYETEGSEKSEPDQQK